MSEKGLIAVPWFSMREWNEVYRKLFSTRVEDQREGLDRLVGWQARSSRLPAMIESTRVIFQVLCDDPHYSAGKSVSVAGEHQLRLMYSTAVMRFLNLMLRERASDAEQDKLQTMYLQAEKANIPQWIVSLRHDAAHGTSLPDLYLLRSAAAFIKKWLKENYWDLQSDLYEDWYLTTDEVTSMSVAEDELGNLLEAWEALSVYKVAGFKDMKQVPDPKLRETICEMLKKDSKDQESVMKGEASYTVTFSLTHLLQKITWTMEKWSEEKSNINTIIADKIIAGNFLLPSKKLLETLYPAGIKTDGEPDVLQALPTVLEECCDDLFYALSCQNVIPELASKLISVSANPNEGHMRRNFAALWAQKIFLSCLKVREAFRLSSKILEIPDFDPFVHYKMGNTKKTSQILAIGAVENRRSELKLGYTWGSFQIPERLQSMEFVKQSIALPSKYTSIFLPSLMELTSPVIPLRAKKLFLDLVHTFCNGPLNSEEKDDGKIFSVNDVPNYVGNNSSSVGPNEVVNGSMMLESTMLESTELGPEPCPESAWTLCPDDIEWGKCPLGLLPWQKEALYREENVKKSDELWPKLFMVPGWTETTSNQPEIRKFANDSSSLRKVKKGGVKKSYLNGIKTPSNPRRNLSQHKSPSQMAIQFLSGFKV